MRDSNLKRRAAHKHTNKFKKLAHRRLKRSKELLKRNNELVELNQEMNYKAGFLINALTAQEKIEGKILLGDFTVTIVTQILEEKLVCRKTRWCLTLKKMCGTARR